MCKKTEKFENFIASNLKKVLDLETKQTLGDRSEYVGASDIGGCPYKTVMTKKHPPVYDLKQQIIFQRGHLAETLVSKMLNGLDVKDQFEVLGEIDQIQLKAHLDKLVKMQDDRCVVVEVKTVSAPIDEPYESWVLQVQYQMGLLMQEGCNDNHIEAYVLAMDLNTGWLKTFYFEFDKQLFELCLNKAQHIADAMKGLCEPKAIIQGYCSSCPFKMQCPKQGQFAEDLPKDLKMDLEFIKKSKAMAKEAKLRENRVKKYFVDMGIETGKDECLQTVVSVKKQESNRFDINSFKKDHSDLYAKYCNTSQYYKITVA